VGESLLHSFVDDFRNEGYNQIICCLESGTISTFNIKDEAESAKVEKGETLLESRLTEDQLENLNKIKQELLFSITELKNAQEQADLSGSTSGG
jgi:hypothetical protein